MNDETPSPKSDAVAQGSSEAARTDPQDVPAPVLADVSLPSALAAARAEVEQLRTRVDKERKRRKKAEGKAEGKAGGTAKLGSSRGIETMFRASYRTHNDLSHLADTKANIMISVNGIIISILLASISPKIDTNPWLLLPTAVLLVACAVSMVYAVLSARPRVTRRDVTLTDVRENRANILFFGNFVQLGEDDFVEGMRELLTHPDQLYVNMIRDIYSLGAVLATKFRLLRTSYTIFMTGLVVGVTLFLAVFALVVAGLGGTITIP